MRTGKGGKDRTTFLPRQLESRLQQHLLRLAGAHRAAVNRGSGYAPLLGALARKYPNAARSFAWQFAFPSTVERRDPQSGQGLRWHVSPATLQRAVHSGVKLAAIGKHVSVHTLRHCFATHLLQSGCDVRTIQTLMGHRSLETTMIYTHVATITEGAVSPLDRL